MNSIKAVFFDFDNTYYSHFTHSIPESNERAVKELRKKGIQCWISTGRSKPELFRLGLKETDFDGILMISGQLAYYHGDRILSRPFTGELKDRVVSLFREGTLPIKLDEEERIYINCSDSLMESVMREINSPVPDVSEYTGNDIYMATVIGDAECLEKTATLFEGCTLCIWHANGVDYVPPDGGKASGIEAILDYFSFKPEEIMAFGDNDNDISMLSYAGLSVAMGNGTDAAKAAADYVTGHIEENGILNALKHFGII